MKQEMKKVFWPIAVKWFAIISIVLGLIFLIWSAGKFISMFAIADKVDATDMASTGQIGDFIGGILGPLWSLTGILLFYIALKYQRDDLKYQVEELALMRQELADTRQEFHTNRITSIFYNQLSRIDEIIKTFKIEGATGFSAVSLLRSNFRTSDDAEEVYEETKIILHNIEQIRGYFESIKEFINRIEDNVAAINYVIGKSDLHNKDKNQFRGLIQINVGDEFVEIVEIIRFSISTFLEIKGVGENNPDAFPELAMLNYRCTAISRAIMQVE